MKLMKRAKNSIVAILKNDDDIIPAFEFPSWLGDAYDGNSKIMLTTREQVVKQLLMKEHEELSIQLKKDQAEDSGEAIFITMALNILDEEIKTLSVYEGISIPNELLKQEVEDAVASGISLSELLEESSLESNIPGAAFSDDEEDVNEVVAQPEEDGAKESSCDRERLISECSTLSNDASLHEDQCND